MPSNNKTNQSPPKRQTRGTRAAAAAATVALMEEAEGDTEAQTQEVQETVIKEESGSEVKVEQDAEMTEVNVASVAMSEEAQPQESGGDEKQEENHKSLHVGEKNGDNKREFRKPWAEKLKELKDGKIVKVPKEIQKRRRNFKLKKMIAPKAPVMILHEMLGTAVTYEVAEPIMPQGPHMPMLFRARAVYQDTEFIGQGPSKSIAKNICAEQVLQFITTQSCLKNEEPESESGSSFETDTPWSALASLAMFKLFNDWQAQGYAVPPELMPGSGLAPAPAPGCGQVTMFGEGPQPQQFMKKQKPKKEKVAKEGDQTRHTAREDKELPPNFKMKNPVQLLNEMKGPGACEWEEQGQEGITPNCVFTLAVRVADDIFTGKGRSKKEAKKAAAVSALSSLYTDYDC